MLVTASGGSLRGRLLGKQRTTDVQPSVRRQFLVADMLAFDHGLAAALGANARVGLMGGWQETVV